MTIDPSKYVVFNRAEYEQAFAMSATKPVYYWAKEIDDAVVIRKQDAFATAGLSAYANAVITAAEVIASYGDHIRANELMEIADFFAAQSDEARSMASKLPDA